jgi:nitrite reductase/ring-hydroxylating ferredoxin subunit
MEGYWKAAKFDEVTPARPQRVTLGGRELVLLKVQDTIFAIENLCPHQQFAVFHSAVLEDHTITCPMHGWSFDIRTGKAVNGNGRIRVFDVRVEGNDIYVMNPEHEERFSRF